MIDIVAVIGSAGTVGLAIACVVFAVRNGGLRAELVRADMLRKTAEGALKDSEKEFTEYRERTEQQLKDLNDELERFENHELDAIEEEPNRVRRIERRRSWVLGVLSKTRASANSEDPEGVREDPTPKEGTSDKP